MLPKAHLMRMHFSPTETVREEICLIKMTGRVFVYVGASLSDRVGVAC